MLWLCLFLASTTGAAYLLKSLDKSVTNFLNMHPDGIQEASSAKQHQALDHAGKPKAIVAAVLALAAIVSLIGVTADFGFGIGLIPMAIVMSLANQWFKQFDQKGKEFDRLFKEYQTQQPGKKEDG
ncbi:hypothetical protein [Armatimonas sp.]|uniref:hypothetical protein n=1 Tax=Armatimonas sp. TaxID=1872638 RepID=UPI00286C218B|nr:hypothetical protein [Armatimonas sp.]